MHVSDFLSNRYAIAVAVPLALLVVSACAKKLVRGPGGWKQSDWHYGLETSLASLSATLIYLGDISIAQRGPAAVRSELFTSRVECALGFAVLSLAFVFVTLTLHQDHQIPAAASPPRLLRDPAFWKLCVLGNFLGAGVMFGFILWKV
jgi:hypothetical protein